MPIMISEMYYFRGKHNQFNYTLYSSKISRVVCMLNIAVLSGKPNRFFFFFLIELQSISTQTQIQIGKSIFKNFDRFLSKSCSK